MYKNKDIHLPVGDVLELFLTNFLSEGEVIETDLVDRVTDDNSILFNFLNPINILFFRRTKWIRFKKDNFLALPEYLILPFKTAIQYNISS